MGKAAFAPVSLYRLPITPLATDDWRVASLFRSSLPLPGLSYPVSFSVGIGAGQLRLSQGDFHPLCFSISARMLRHRLPVRPAQDGTPCLDGSSGIRIKFPAT